VDFEHIVMDAHRPNLSPPQYDSRKDRTSVLNLFHSPSARPSLRDGLMQRQQSKFTLFGRILYATEGGYLG
jgi:hypothetical protein